MSNSPPAAIQSRAVFKISADLSIEKTISVAKRFNPFVVLNSNASEQLQKDNYSSYDILVAAGAIEIIRDGESVFDDLKENHNLHHDWIVGFFSYDIKNQVEQLSSSNDDSVYAGNSFFFRPRFVIGIKDNLVSVYYDRNLDTDQSAEKLIHDMVTSEITPTYSKHPVVHSKITRNEYINTFNQIKKHIALGDIYELNYCIEFYSENTPVDPCHCYLSLNRISPMPFSTYFQKEHFHLMCASPERFLAKRGRKIISQPIKGTTRRGTTDAEDEFQKSALQNSSKEKSENVMIVDLVRNDLSRTAEKNSVQVEELFGLKSFRMLHHLVSTVTSEIKDGIHFTEVLKCAFPMGSMTGAPKIRAMELIEEFETTKRGAFSGAVGYINPEGDFDFNVVIRSIFYNSDNHYLSFMAGSAITIASEAEKEYEECLLKAEGMKKVLA